MHAPLVCLLLSCAVALSGAGVVLDGGLPIMWAHSTGTLTDLPIIEGKLAPDPWHYLQRMSLFRLLIAKTDTFMGPMGPGENQSPLWGLPLQLGWMLSSGRLVDPTGATTCGTQEANMCVSPSSWWGCVNYFSSVLPFLSAAHKEFFGAGVSVEMQIPAGVEGYCTTYDTCKAAHSNAMDSWDAFYQGLIDSGSSTLTDLEKKDAILGLYWNAALASTHASSPAAICGDKLNSYSGPEKAFAQSWQNAGEYVAAVHFQSSLDLAAQFMAPLPGRILKEEDSPPNIPDLTAEENHSLYIFSWIQSMDSLMASTFGGTLVGAWRQAMCSVSARESGRDMLKNLLLTQEGATSNFLAVVSTMSMSCS